MNKYLDAINKQLELEYLIYSKTIKSPAVLVSGGLDSSVIAVLTNKYFTDCQLFSFGTDKNSDKPFAEILGKHLGKKISWLNINLLDLEKNLETVKNLLIKAKVETDLTNLSLGLGYFLIFKKIKKEGIKYVFTGQGPDILFAGYHRYRRLTARQLDSAIKKDLELLEIDKRRDSAVAEHFGLQIISPYLDPDFIKLALEIPAQYKIKNKIEKYIVRHYAKMIGVPNDLATRPKKAFQYSTGIQSLLLKQKKIY
jgi:asparagine synthase (glutamine-hydrolysing)